MLLNSAENREKYQNFGEDIGAQLKIHSHPKSTKTQYNSWGLETKQSLNEKIFSPLKSRSPAYAQIKADELISNIIVKNNYGRKTQLVKKTIKWAK